MTALFSFLGGSIFRMIWGEISSYLKQKQEHSQELELMKIQAEQDAKRHTRSMELAKFQAELEVKQVEVITQGEVDKEEAKAYTLAIRAAAKATGIKWIDAWRASIRPLIATVCVFLWVLKLNAAGWVMDQWDMDIAGVYFGFYVADRSLSKRNK